MSKPEDCDVLVLCGVTGERADLHRLEHADIYLHGGELRIHRQASVLIIAPGCWFVVEKVEHGGAGTPGITALAEAADA